MSLATRRALYGKMAGDSTLTTLLGTAGSGYTQRSTTSRRRSEADFPYVIFQQQSGTPTYTFDRAHAAMDEEVWTIKGVDRAGAADAADEIAGSARTRCSPTAAISISGQDSALPAPRVRPSLLFGDRGRPALYPCGWDFSA